MARKIYGVKGLMEWTALIRVGKATIRIPFIGGSMSAFGVIPATYSTSDAVLQHIIEKSDYFANGRILLIRVLEEEKKEEKTNAPKLETKEVSCIEDAKEYLVETYNVNRSELRSKKSIEDYALSKGIKFEGI